MNNKGAIFSGFMYVLLVFFLLSLASLLVVLSDTKKVSNKAREGAQEIIEDDTSEFAITLTGSTSMCLNFGIIYSEPGFSAKDKDGNVLTVTVSSDLDIWKVGTYTITYTAKDKGKTKSVERKVNVMKNDYIYTGSSELIIPKCDGYYTVELWGADHSNGLSGYTKGTIKLSTKDKLYLYVGQYSTAGDATSFNGGTGSSGGYPGGGATDIRLLNKTWNDLDSLKSRIMVAGGAGAGNIQYSHGGGLIGKRSGTATEGTQTSPGIGVGYPAASFGVGGGGCGGGGGYYGAGGAACATGGAGGSGFISGASGSNAITNDIALTHTNNTLHFSGKYFVNNIIEMGKTELDRPGSSHGKAKITYIDSEYPKTDTDFNNVRYVKDCANGSTVNADNHWIELQVIKNGLNLALGKSPVGTSPYNPGAYPYDIITDGMMDDPTKYSSIESATYPGLQCVTIDLGKAYDIDEIAVWHYYPDGRTYTLPSTEVSTDNITWRVLMDTPGPETPNGFRVSAWEISIFSAETLIVAGGGGGGTNHGGGGGAGGLLEKTVPIVEGTSYSVTVGGGGAPAPSSTLPASNGGNSIALGFTASGGGGGGNRNDSTQTSPGRNGGSGGGGGGSQPTLPLNRNPGTGISGQGNNGGAGVDLLGGGGGGAGNIGTTATTVAGNGGTGITSSLSGISKLYAGGGGGGAYGTVGQGGSGIGGTGSSATTFNGTIPAPNTGSGGGGGGHTMGLGGTGSNGIVIIRYLGSQKATGGTITSVNGYTIHTFIGVGTYSFIVN